MGRWDSDAEDWRGWKDGKYDNRYAGTSRRKSYRNPYKKKQAKKIGIGITIFLIIGAIGFVIFEQPQFLTNLPFSEFDKIKEKTLDATESAKNTLTDTINNSNLQETVDSAQKQIKDSAKSVPSDIEKSLSPVQDVIKDAVKPVQPEIKDTIESVQNKITETTEPLITIDSKKSHDELVQYALEEINKDRAKNNLNPVLLSTNVAAQNHADDVIAQRMISHWMSNGEKPYMTYTSLGGTGSVSQNIATSSCSGYGCSTDPITQITSSEYDMMYDDASSNWGHRDNILQPYHTHVSIGISFNDNFFVMVQNFEDNYLISENPISVTGNHVSINSDLKSGSIQSIGIFYDSLPTPELYLQHRNDGYYELGDNVAVVVQPPPPNSYYDQPSGYKLIEADRWNGDNSVLIDFDLSSVLTRPGVYTVGVWVDEGGESFLVTNYSIFYKG